MSSQTVTDISYNEQLIEKITDRWTDNENNLAAVVPDLWYVE